jgi:hypothetical protein
MKTAKRGFKTTSEGSTSSGTLAGDAGTLQPKEALPEEASDLVSTSSQRKNMLFD